MDKIPSASGGAPDGAFERFLTAAIATIITIMFSWRLLAEEEEASGATGSVFSSSKSLQFSVDKNANFQTKSPDKSKLSKPRMADLRDIDLSLDEGSVSHPRSADDHQIVHEDIVYDRHDPVQKSPLEAIHIADDSISSISSADDSLTVDTLTTWDEYKWEEETGQEQACVIKTRRTVRDFVTSPNSRSLDLLSPNKNEGLETHSLSLGASPSNNAALSPSVPFSQRFANFEYKDTGGDSGYIDLYPDIESDDDTDSSDDEHVYEIQVSDSDSDSEEDRGGAFFGVTSLDTIMEEYESDVSEKGEDVHSENYPGEGNKIYDGVKMNVAKQSSSKPYDNVCDISETNKYSDREFISNSNSSATDSAKITSLTFQNVADNENKTDQISESGMLQNKIEINAKCQTPQSDTQFRSSEADDFECNLSPDKSHSEDVKFTIRNTEPTVTVCDLNINQEQLENCDSIPRSASIGFNEKSAADAQSERCEEISQPKFVSCLSEAPKSKREMLNLKLSDDSHKISEISDDSLPPSPVRTCALDNLAEEPFSDTESCSSESVITVVSVKSNDSDNYSDRNNNASNFQNNLPVINIDPASGNKLSSVLNDQTTDCLGKYESFSLVSGFLNDSLNSLLSANTGSVENDSDAESSSGKENLGQENENQSEALNMNGKVTSDDSCVSSAESLPVVEEITEINAQISENGHFDSADSVVIEHDQNLIEQNENTEFHRYSDSDNSSDSSDPPLREYDPGDDDLAAFQFNLDSDDDSFFLVIADNENDDEDDDEGKLRNFRTFTNLNSVGLSPEYGDAVISHTLPDDAKGFKFSHTEDISTQFKKRTYFTDRSNLSDSDTRSDGPLSPITSEDESKEEKSNEQNITRSNNEDMYSPPTKLPNLSSYGDAEISTTKSVSENESNKIPSSGQIDFKKYIINTDLSPIAEDVHFPEETAVIIDHCQIDKDYMIQDRDQKFEIDTLGDKMGSLSVNEMNNLQHNDGQDETLSSLTEKIERLTQNSSECVEISDSKVAKSESECLDKRDVNRTSKIYSKAQNVDEHISADSNKKDLEKSRETATDDQFTKSASEELQDRDKSGNRRKTVETNIDDLFESSNENISSSHSKIETNVDDILNETNFGRREICSVQKKSNAPSKSKIETNIDEIFDENYAPVHSTPLKSEWKPKRETNIDEFFESTEGDEDSLQNKKQKSKLETSVDDLLNDLNDVNKYTQSPLKDRKDIDTSGKSSENLGSQSLSYETFVDDLFDLPPKSSQAHAHSTGSALTSESAIFVQSSKESLLPPGRPRGVQAENTAEQINVEQNNRRAITIADNVQKANDPRQTDIVHVEKIVSTDNKADNSSDKIGFDTKEHKHKTRPPQYDIGTNYRNISKEPEKSNKTSQSHRYNVDNEGSVNKSVENFDEQKPGNGNNITESEETISCMDNFETDNRQSLQNNLKPRQSEFKDHNASISLPKAETLNNEKKTTHIGHSPGRDNRYNYKHGDISLVADPSNTRSQNNVENILQAGVQINESLLKSEEECELSDVELKIVENTEDHVKFVDENLDSIGSCSLASEDGSLSSLESSFNSLQDSYKTARLRGLSDSEVTSRVVRTPATKPSDFLLKSKDLKGVKKKVYRHNLKKYTSILQQPVTPERVNITFESPQKAQSLSRLKVLKSREKFLSAENLSHGSFEDKFLQHRTSLASTPRKYLKHHESHLQSTESLPSDMALWNTSYGSNVSMEKLHSLPSPRYFEEMYGSRYSSANSSFEKAEYDKLHANCIFSPGKREEIRHTKESLENMFEQLLRYGSISSLATETDLDADVTDDVNAHGQSLHDTYYISFQYPLERAASMSAITEPHESHRLPRKPGKGRFANRKVPKSKSLQTLETNLDDVFADESIEPGKLSRTPSEHELRVSKSLSKLNVPDWFRKSSFSRSGSTQSLFTYATRTGSTSTIGSSAYPPSLTTSPSPSVTPGSNAVIIQKRVTPTSTVSPSARLLRAPMLPTTPEKAPIHNIPQILPSDRYRRQEKKESLKPIAIVPFAKLREMFEKKSQDDAKSKSPVTSPTKEKPPAKVRFEPASPSAETIINDDISDTKPVQNDSERTLSPPPPVPERKPILTDHSVKHSDSSAHQPRRTQVHFSDENHVSRSQEQNTNILRPNGTAPNTSSSSSSGSVKKPQSLRASLPLPQFRFRRPGSFARQAAAAASQSSSQSKKETTV